MNFYKFGDLSVGMTESFDVDITREMIDRFIDLTGDVGPIHENRQYAVEHGFKARVCHGMLFAGMFSTLVGVYLPGEHCLLHSINVKFLNPVYPGDRLKVTGRITEMNETFKVVKVKGAIYGPDGKKVCKADIQLGMRE